MEFRETMIYLATRKVPGDKDIIHEFYMNGLFYSYGQNRYRVCGLDGNKTEHIVCASFEYELPETLNIITYYNHIDRMIILERIVEQKIFENI